MNSNRTPYLLCFALALAAITFTLTPRAQAQAVSVLYTFSGATDGYGPYASLVFDSVGNLYGTTVIGGTSNAGAVFRLTPSSTGWQESVLYSFTGGNDGANPWSSLVLDAAGNLYGTTYFGGKHGYGTVFSLSPSSTGWSLTVLHAFTGSFDGGNPHAGVILDAAGNVYGTTYFGGRGNGVVFELSRANGWKENVLHMFTGLNDGGYPGDSLIFDPAGNLYGTTTAGGLIHDGVVFRLSPTSSGTWKEAVLHAFKGGNDGSVPWGRLALDSAGNLYGTTLNGGSASACSGMGCGTVFRLKPNSKGGWIENLLYSFAGQADGSYPYAGVTLDASGNLYGATYFAGNLADCAGSGCGNVYELSQNSSGHWEQKVLYEFTGGADGGDPYSAPIFDAAGNLYGVAPQNGASEQGVVYEITP